MAKVYFACGGYKVEDKNCFVTETLQDLQPLVPDNDSFMVIETIEAEND